MVTNEPWEPKQKGFKGECRLADTLPTRVGSGRGRSMTVRDISRRLDRLKALANDVVD